MSDWRHQDGRNGETGDRGDTGMGGREEAGREGSPHTIPGIAAIPG